MKTVCLECFTLDELVVALTEAFINASAKSSQTKNLSDSKLLTRKEAAEFLDITYATLNTWTKQGRVTAYRIKSRIYYKEEELLASLEKINHNKYKNP